MLKASKAWISKLNYNKFFLVNVAIISVSCFNYYSLIVAPPAASEKSALWDAMNQATSPEFRGAMMTVLSICVWTALVYSKFTLPGYASTRVVTGVGGEEEEENTTGINDERSASHKIAQAAAKARGMMLKRMTLPEGASVCKKCNCLRPNLAHHCRQCERCVLEMDHHCVWVGNCVGKNNLFAFRCFILSASLCSFIPMMFMLHGFISVVGSDTNETVSLFYHSVGSAVSSAFGLSLNANHSSQWEERVIARSNHQFVPITELIDSRTIAVIVFQSILSLAVTMAVGMLAVMHFTQNGPWMDFFIKDAESQSSSPEEEEDEDYEHRYIIESAKTALAPASSAAT